MKVQISEESQRMLMLLKLDALRLFERIKYRAPDYMGVFSLKRTRDHFPDIFKNRYDLTTIKELMLCGQEVIVGLDQFYSKVDEIRWYLNHTQDMPNRVEDRLHGHIRELEKYFTTLNLYIDAEMGLMPVNEVKEETDETSFTEDHFVEVSEDETDN